MRRDADKKESRMLDALGGLVWTTPPVLAQLFNDVSGFLLGAEFLSALANLVATLLTELVTGFLGAFFGFAA